MSLLLRLLSIYILIECIFGSKYYEESCDRIRRPFHLLTIEERMLYVEGFQQLRENGVLDKITRVHGLVAHRGTVKGSNFLYWHTYYIWELETQIRRLGGKFECFSLPYWDFTYDAGKESDSFILNTVMGGDGDPEDDFCVDGDLWSQPNYFVPQQELCADDESKPNCCLKRATSPTQLLPTTAQVASVIVNNPDWKTFAREMKKNHGYVHLWFGSDEEIAMQGCWAPDDPIFFLFHSYIEYLRALWVSCWNYDEIDTADLNVNRNIYEAYCDENHKEFDFRKSSCGAIKWTDTLDWYPLSEYEGSLSSKMDIKLSMLHNLRDWGVKYELGTFWESSRVNQFCQENHPDFMYNTDWFVFTKENNELLDIAYKQQSDTQTYIDQLWQDLDENDKIRRDPDPASKYKMVSSLSCEYNREHSENSCWDESMSDLEIETCSDRGIHDASDLELDDLLNFEGVKDNQCLQEIRENAFHETSWFGERVKLQLCNGEFDYQCPEYDDIKYSLSDDQMLLKNENIHNEIALLSHENKFYFISVIFVGIISISCVILLYYTKQRGDNIKQRKLTSTYQYSTF